MYLSELGDVLRQARKSRNLTLQQAAAQAGIHFTTLSALERGQVSELGIRKVLRVAEVLGLELVLRPSGQAYTLDDVARERAAMLQGSKNVTERMHRNGLVPASSNAQVVEHRTLLARALREPGSNASGPWAPVEKQSAQNPQEKKRSNKWRE